MEKDYINELIERYSNYNEEELLEIVKSEEYTDEAKAVAKKLIKNLKGEIDIEEQEEIAKDCKEDMYREDKNKPDEIKDFLGGFIKDLAKVLYGLLLIVSGICVVISGSEFLVGISVFIGIALCGGFAFLMLYSLGTIISLLTLIANKK